MLDPTIVAPGQKTSYRVQLPVFEGPLDLLLHLIERDELDITRVSLALVAGQYLAYLSALKERHVDDLTDFIVVASRLLLIKSRALLPRPPTPAHEEDGDPAEELLRQLQAYKKFKEAAKQLAERQLEGQRSFVRMVPQPRIETGIEHLEAVSLEALVLAARRAMRARPTTPQANSVVEPFNITIDEQIELIAGALQRQPMVNFTSILTAACTRQEVIVSFLAVLELIKRGIIQVKQDRMFGEIFITPA